MEASGQTSLGAMGSDGSRPALWHRVIEIAADALPRLVGVALLAAAFEKAWSIGWGNSPLKEVLRFDGFSEFWVERLARLVLTCEGVLGTVLLLGVGRRWVLHTASVVLLVFSGQLVYLLMSKEPPSCGCLSWLNAFAEERHNTILGLVRNGLFVLALEWSWYVGRDAAPTADRLPLEDQVV
jgi:hypothetical protein